MNDTSAKMQTLYSNFVDIMPYGSSYLRPKCEGQRNFRFEHEIRNMSLSRWWCSTNKRFVRYFDTQEGDRTLIHFLLLEDEEEIRDQRDPPSWKNRKIKFYHQEQEMERRKFFREALLLSATVAVECTTVGLNTLFKAAASKGLSYYVFVAYSYPLATLALLPLPLIFRKYKSLFIHPLFYLLINLFIILNNCVDKYV